jgi:hypothetical protein
MSTELLELAASTLGPLVKDLVFVGGATIHIWITEPAAPSVRSTDDVDVICDTVTLSRYYRLAEQLRARGFTEAIGDPVICRWRHRDSGLVLDVMPADEAVLGFSNPWYGLALETAFERELPSGQQIRAVAPALIVATKLAAWKGRGNGDILASLDLHDIIALVDGRPELADELAAHPRDLRQYIADELASLRSDPYLGYIIQGAVQEYGRVAAARAAIVEDRIKRIAEPPCG